MRKEQQSGVGALTASELRVARRASEGFTNRGIAQNLFVTVKTAEKDPLEKSIGASSGTRAFNGTGTLTPGRALA